MASSTIDRHNIGQHHIDIGKYYLFGAGKNPSEKHRYLKIALKNFQLAWSHEESKRLICGAMMKLKYYLDDERKFIICKALDEYIIESETQDSSPIETKYLLYHFFIRFVAYKNPTTITYQKLESEYPMSSVVDAIKDRDISKFAEHMIVMDGRGLLDSSLTNILLTIKCQMIRNDNNNS